MRIMKKLLTSTLVMVLLLASVVSVSAKGSYTDDAYVSGDSVGYYEVGGCGHVDDNGVPKHDGKTQITETFDIVERNGGNVVDGKHQVEITVPGLTDNLSGVVVSVRNQETGEWCTVTPDSVGANGELKLQLPWVGDAVVFASVSGVVDNSQGKSPATANTSEWALWMGAAAVMCVAGVVVSKKHN